MRHGLFIGAAIGILVGVFPAPRAMELIAPAIAAGAHSDSSAPTEEKKELTPEERMNRRFPQPARVGDLIGLPVLDWDDSMIGYVRQIVRTPDGKIQLIVPYGAWFGWLDFGGRFDRARRPVAVPIEVVAILARQIDALDMSRKEFAMAPRFVPGQAAELDRDEIIKIAITRR